MPNKLNSMMKDELRGTLDQVPSAVLVNYQGLKSDQTYALRKDLKAKNVKIRVIKNSIAKLALTDLGVKGIDKVFQGPVALCWFEDPALVAKTLIEWKKKTKGLLEIKGALLERRLLTPEETLKLASLPGKDQLRAQLLGTFNAPITSFVSVLAGTLRKLVYAIKAIEEKKGKASGEAAPAAAADAPAS